MRRMMKSKAGVINQLNSLVSPIVGFAVLLAVGFLILAQIKANTTVAADANATAAINTTQSALSDIPTWLPIIIIAVIGAIIIGLVRFFR